MTTNLSTDHSQATLATDDPSFTPVVGTSRGDRSSSFNLSDFPVPTGTEEDWRFTPVRDLAGFFTELTGTQPLVSAQGVELEVVGRDDSRLGTVQAPGDRSSAVAWNSFEKAYVATLTGVGTEGLITVTGQGGEPAPLHLLIVAEENSESTVVLSHGGSGQVSETIEIDVKDGAQLTFVTIQEWEDEAIHLSNNRLRLGKDSSIRHIVVTLGGKIVRITTDGEYAGTGGDMELLGAYYTDAGQHQEHRLFVNHATPNCRSNATYKGALQGTDAHAVWIGDVLITPDATGTDTYELNRNLVLTQGAKADSVPNLEIKTGEIEGAGHASATGRFDDEQLFYLRARGIPEDVARRLVVRGFFASLINQIGVPMVQDKLMEAIELELDQTMASVQA
ncbi:Fe-S cluster assembly protein SufD [Flaviflexus equikiangi]|uniref:Fe-S cluster assembly protein SufD n=1 Tax=Flaviflexus equikiangi TaxID=2758573 RepID=A0ABS2TFD8_9ACTO|nr:Fe-S cluster assembly protein SufD [Flaviflexus equikiangi]MBM9433347.1 Fe-S cluster assembly protein SufD [Flaviflexus equikiangi]